MLEVPVAQPGSTPITLATLSAPVYFQGIAVTGSTVVFTTDDRNYPVTGGLWTAKVGVAKQSLTAIDSFSGIQAITGPALNSAGTIAYITQDPLGSGSNPTVSKVEACTIASANTCTVLETLTTNDLSNPVVSGTYLFFADYIAGTLQRYTLPSGPFNGTWLTGESQIQHLAADATRVIWQYDGVGNSSVTIGGAVASASAGSEQPLGFGNLTDTGQGLASDGKFGYFAHYNYMVDPNVGSVQYAPVTGGTVVTLYSGASPHGVIAANGGIYWIDGAVIYGQRFP